MTTPGELRHETCRFGVLTPAVEIHPRQGWETKTLLPLCHWTPSPAPPAVIRAWGGLVEFDDCARCPCHSPL